jgi:hypothetical protein
VSRIDWAVRGYLVFAAVQGFGIGLTGLIAPDQMQIPLRLTPLNARFVAALYVAGAIGVVLAAANPRRLGTRLFCIGFGFATLLILVLTIVHWSDFMDPALPHRAVWIFDYVVDPLLALILIPLAGLWPARHPSHHALSRMLFIKAICFGGLGAILLLAPSLAANYWPWALPPTAGQLYACFLLTFGIGDALAARESDARAVRDFLIAALSLCLLVLLVSALHLDRFKPDPVTPIWFLFFAAWGTASGASLVLWTRRSPIQRAPAVV